MRISKEQANDLLEFETGDLPASCKRGPMYEKGDEKQPFFSEAYLYNLLGKEDARTLLALMRPVWDAAGIDRKDQP